MLLICLDYTLGVFNMPRLYSPSFLKAISTLISSTPLVPVLWRCLVNHGISKSKPTRRGCRAGQRKLKSKGNTSPTPLDSQPCKIINGKEIYEIHEDQYLHNTLPGTLNIQTVTSANAASWDFPQRSTKVKIIPASMDKELCLEFLHWCQCGLMSPLVTISQHIAP